MSHHGYADDTQGYLVIKSPSHWTDSIPRIQNCMSAVSKWMCANSLKLNADKFEYIIFYPKRCQLNPLDYSLTLSGVTYLTVSQVRNLGSVQDCNLTMEQHISSVTKSCYHQIRSIGKIRKYITTDACRTLVQALVTSRMDYANSLLYGITQAQTARLQRLQNCAARLITRTPRHEHITPVLMELHWLPTAYRPQFKVLLLTYKALHALAPAYLSDMIKEYRPTRSLRSANKRLLVVPRTKTQYGKRSFRHASAVLWNELPEHVKDAQTVQTFKRLLKTHLFQLAYY